MLYNIYGANFGIMLNLGGNSPPNPPAHAPQLAILNVALTHDERIA
ncbi:MAG: hypothetical protein JW798_06495 [Prolixibacteraceae bacterium]|nr:hypothetical protein [Prolixibacteraceae bacterium]